MSAFISITDRDANNRDSGKGNTTGVREPPDDSVEIREPDEDDDEDGEDDDLDDEEEDE